MDVRRSSAPPRSPRARGRAGRRGRARSASPDGGVRARRAGAGSRTAACRRGRGSGCRARRRLADALQAGLVRREALQPGMELDAAHPVLADAALDLSPAPGSRGSTVAKATSRSRCGSDPGRERVVGSGARPQQALVREDDREVDAELVHRERGTPAPRMRLRPAGGRGSRSRRHQAGEHPRRARSARQAPGSRSPRRGRGRVAAREARVDEALELEREADVGLVARGLEGLASSRPRARP